MPLSFVRRHARRLYRHTKSWGTVVALTLSGNKIERRADFAKSKNPVLLIYGFGATRRTFSILEKRLFNDGYMVFSIRLGGILDTFNTDPIETLAAIIDQKIESLYAKFQIKERMSIISHSKGGLIGHYYIKRLGGDKRVKLLITLGTPHNGSTWALLFAFTPVALLLKSVRQMAPMSNFIRRLKQGEFPKMTKMYSIYSKDDKVCVYPGAVIEEASNVKNLEVAGISHSEFLIKKSVYELMKLALEDQVPKSLEDRTKEKLKSLKNPPKKKTLRLKIIQGAKQIKARA